MTSEAVFDSELFYSSGEDASKELRLHKAPQEEERFLSQRVDVLVYCVPEPSRASYILPLGPMFLLLYRYLGSLHILGAKSCRR